MKLRLKLLQKSGLKIESEQFQDCGLMIYKEDQPVQAGGSGAGCSATVLYGHLLNQMKQGRYKRILLWQRALYYLRLPFSKMKVFHVLHMLFRLKFRKMST